METKALPTASQKEADVHEIELNPAVLSNIVRAKTVPLPVKVMAFPDPSTAAQNDVVGQDTEVKMFGGSINDVDHVEPL